MGRSLGNLERAMWLMDQRHSLNFVGVCTFDGLLDADRCRRAVDLLQQRHPLLRARIDDSPAPRFVTDEVPLLPLRIVDAAGSDDWRLEAERELNTPLPWKEGPLARITWVRQTAQSHLLVAFHHAAGDGYSAIYLLRDLLEIASALMAGREPTIAALPFPPSIEDSIREHRVGWRWLPRSARAIGSLLMERFRYKPEQLPIADPAAPRRSRLLHEEFTPEQTERLCQRCREAQVTVHGALSVAIMKQVADHLARTHQGNGHLDITCFSPIDLREILALPDSQHTIGFFNGVTITYHRFPPTPDLWEMARQLSAHLRRQRESKDILFLSSLQGSISARMSPEQMEKQRPPISAAVTNLRVLNIPGRFDSLSVHGFHFALASHSLGASPVLALATHQGRLHANLTYTEPFLEESVAKSLLTGTFTELLPNG